jgi:alanine racemase
MPARRASAHEAALESGPPETEAGGLLTIDVAAVVDNWRDLAQRSAPAECSAVVKADAYGLGLEPIARALARAGCQTFFVAHLSEGRALRAALSEPVIYVLNGLAPATTNAYAQSELRPVIGSLAEFAEWTRFRAQSGYSGCAALHVDTGMNRLGLTPEEASGLAARNSIGRHGITLLMSHFACSEEPGHALNARQMADFRDVRALFPDIPASLANSSGIFLGPDALHDIVRPGIALYGANPTPGHINLMRPVVRLDGRIIQVREVAEGESVGYGATWTAKQPTRLAIAALGYADGFLRAASVSDLHPGAEAIVAGKRCPLAGRVSMDLLAIDVTDVPGDGPQRGDWATLLGDEIGVDELASHAGTIAYEVLTNLGRRYRRVYRGS